MGDMFLRRKALTRDTYEKTVEGVADALKTVPDAASLLVYGSFLDDRLLPGVSDIDMVIFFWRDTVLCPKTLAKLSGELGERLLRASFDAPLLLDASVIDDGLGRDGRFIPQDDNFSKMLSPDTGDARLVCGRPFVERLRPVRLLDSVEERLAYNLQSLRLHLLLGECVTGVHARDGAAVTLRLLQNVRSVPRKLLALLDPGACESIKDKSACLQSARALMPATDFGAFEKLERLFRRADTVIETVARGDGRHLLQELLTAYESVLRDVVAAVPMRSRR